MRNLICPSCLKLESKKKMIDGFMSELGIDEEQADEVYNSVIEIRDNEIAIIGYDMLCLVDLINVQITERFVLEKEIPICHSFEYHQLVKYYEGESIFVIRKDMVGIFDYNNRMYGEKGKMVLKVKDVHYNEENKKLIGINWEKEQIEIWN